MNNINHIHIINELIINNNNIYYDNIILV